MRFRRIGRRLASGIAAWFQRLSVLGKITVSVAAIHFFALFALLVQHLASPTKTPTKPIAIRTFQPIAAPPPPPKQKAAPKPIPQKAPAPKRKTTAKPTPKAPPIAKAPPILEKKAPPEIKLPTYLEKSPVAVIAAKADFASFGQSLATLLQETLQLPEIGEVEARIVLIHPGKIEEVEILHAKSAKNAEWLKNQLPRLELPCFNDFSISDAKLEFTITFRNVEN